MLFRSLPKSEAFWTWVYDRLLSECGVDAGARPAIAHACHVAFNDFASWRAFTDTATLLEALDLRRAEGLHVGVLSNWESWLAPLLVHMGIASHFDALTVSGEVALEKPDAGIFDHALAAAVGVDEGNNAIVVVSGAPVVPGGIGAVAWAEAVAVVTIESVGGGVVNGTEVGVSEAPTAA